MTSARLNPYPNPLPKRWEESIRPDQGGRVREIIVKD